MERKTHKVIDLVYHEHEGNVAMVGTQQECQDFVTEQDTVGYEIVPLLKEEIEFENRQS